MKATNNQPPMIRYAETPAKRDYEMLEFNRFIKANGLSAFKMNPHFPVNSLRIMRMAVAAQHEGVAAAYNEAMFAAMWEEGRNLTDPETVAEVITAAGLERTDLARNIIAAGLKLLTFGLQGAALLVLRAAAR